MAIWSNTLIKGIINVTDQILLSEYKYNTAKLDGNIQIIGEESIENHFVGKETKVKSINNVEIIANNNDSNIAAKHIALKNGRIVITRADKITIGTSNPSTTNAENGQIYFKIIN